MIVYISLAIFVVAVGFLVTTPLPMKNKFEKKLGLAGVNRRDAVAYGALVVIFLALFLVSALRIAVGNDYWGYRDSFNLIAQGRRVSSEFGFNFVVRICQLLSLKDDNYLPIFAVFSFLTVFFFVKALYQQSEWFVFTIFLFMTSGFYYQSLNTIRYYFALALAAYAMKYVIQKDWIAFVLIILAGACFHKSVLVVLLLYPLARYHWKKLHLILALGACGSLIIFKDLYRRIVFTFYPYYENSVFDNGNTSVVNILKCLAVIILCIIFYKQAIKDNEQNLFYFYLNVGALGMYLFASFIPEISRIGYYMTFSQVFLIPSVIRAINNKWLKILIAAGVIVCFIAYFALFLYGAREGIRILPYFNILFN